MNLPVAASAQPQDRTDFASITLTEKVALVESAAPEPVAPTPHPPEPIPPPPPPDAIPEPKPELAKPHPPRPPPKRIATKPAPAVKISTRAPANKLGSPNGTSGAPPGKPGPGDNGHATWRNKVRPTYPEAARAARLTGSVQIQVNVNALGQPVGVRLVRSSGVPSLDEAALRAARAFSFNPKRLAGIPLPDTIIVPITFRLDGR